MSCYINALGVVCSAGNGIDELHRNLFGPSNRFFQRVDCLSSGEVKYVGGVTFDLPPFPEKYSCFFSRTNHLAYTALLQFENDIGYAIAKYGASRLGVIVGTCTSGATEIDRTRREEKQTGSIPDGYDYSVEYMDNVSAFIGRWLGIDGPAISVSTACTSSGKAIAMAKRYLEVGLLDAVIVGGADSFALSTLNGFDSLASLSEGFCTPFGEDRDGINLGEGAAFFLMSRDTGDIQLVGAGESSDAYHMSSPQPEGEGAELAIVAALNDARLMPSDIGYINLHGTGTPANDSMEACLVNRVFGENVPVSTIKNLIGHTLGAASAIELCACISLWKQDQPMAIPQYRDYPLDCNLPTVHLAEINDRCLSPLILSNSYAFGGSNCSLIIGPGGK